MAPSPTRPILRAPALGPLAFEYIQTPDIGGPCQGDSGGPAFVGTGANKRVAGVTSYGDADCTIFGVSARVSGYYADFIAPRIGGTHHRPARPVHNASAPPPQPIPAACRTSWARCEKGACAATDRLLRDFPRLLQRPAAQTTRLASRLASRSSPTGVAQYDTYSTCICDQQCTTPCAAECVADPGPDPTTCNGCTETKGPTSCSAQITACEDSARLHRVQRLLFGRASAAELSRV